MNNVFSVVVHKEKKYYVAGSTELYLEEFPMKKTSKPFVSFFEVAAYGKASKTIRA
jgi:hypothetical protein